MFPNLTYASSLCLTIFAIAEGDTPRCLALSASERPSRVPRGRARVARIRGRRPPRRRWAGSDSGRGARRGGEGLAVGIVADDGAPLQAAHDDVVQRPRSVEAGPTGQGFDLPCDGPSLGR